MKSEEEKLCVHKNKIDCCVPCAYVEGKQQGFQIRQESKLPTIFRCLHEPICNYQLQHEKILMEQARQKTLEEVNKLKHEHFDNLRFRNCGYCSALRKLEEALKKRK